MNNDYVQMPQQMNELKNKSRVFFQKRSKLLILLGIALLVAVVLIDQCFFIVNEAEQAVVSRFGVITIIVDEHSVFMSVTRTRLRTKSP